MSYSDTETVVETAEEKKKKANPKLRSDEDRTAHYKAYKFKGRQHYTYTVPFFRPMPPQETPANAAKRYAGNLLVASIVWLGCSCAGYVITLGKHPLPPDESSNIDRIVNSPYVAKWFVNMLMSSAFTGVMFAQWFLLRWYTFDRSLRQARVEHFKRGVLMMDDKGEVKGDIDTWDLEEAGLQAPRAPVTGLNRVVNFATNTFNSGYSGGYGYGSSGPPSVSGSMSGGISKPPMTYNAPNLSSYPGTTSRRTERAGRKGALPKRTYP